MTPKKKTPERKRTPFPREVLYAKGFVDDWEKLSRSGKHDMNRIKEVISLRNIRVTKNSGTFTRPESSKIFPIVESLTR